MGGKEDYFGGILYLIASLLYSLDGNIMKDPPNFVFFFLALLLTNCAAVHQHPEPTHFFFFVCCFSSPFSSSRLSHFLFVSYKEYNVIIYVGRATPAESRLIASFLSWSYAFSFSDFLLHLIEFGVDPQTSWTSQWRLLLLLLHIFVHRLRNDDDQTAWCDSTRHISTLIHHLNFFWGQTHTSKSASNRPWNECTKQISKEWCHYNFIIEFFSSPRSFWMVEKTQWETCRVYLYKAHPSLFSFIFF